MQPNIKAKLSSLVLLSKCSEVLKIQKMEKKAKGLFPANSLSAAFYVIEEALLILMGHQHHRKSRFFFRIVSYLLRF